MVSNYQMVSLSLDVRHKVQLESSVKKYNDRPKKKSLECALMSQLFSYNCSTIASKYRECMVYTKGENLHIWMFDENFSSKQKMCFVLERIEVERERGVTFIIKIVGMEILIPKMLPGIYCVGTNTFMINGKTELECTIKKVTLLRVNVENNESEKLLLLEMCLDTISSVNYSVEDALEKKNKRELLDITKTIEDFNLISISKEDRLDAEMNSGGCKFSTNFLTSKAAAKQKRPH